MQSFDSNCDVSKWVKNSWVRWRTPKEKKKLQKSIYPILRTTYLKKFLFSRVTVIKKCLKVGGWEKNGISEQDAFSNINLDIYENGPDSVPKKKTCHWGMPKTETYFISDWYQCAAKKLSICQLVFQINYESAFKPFRSGSDSIDVGIFVTFGITFLIFLKWNILPQQFLWHHWINVTLYSLKDVGSCYQTY